MHLLGEFEVDHIYPVSRLGTNHINNFQLLTQTCNSKKAGMDPIEFMKKYRADYAVQWAQQLLVWKKSNEHLDPEGPHQVTVLELEQLITEAKLLALDAQIAALRG